MILLNFDTQIKGTSSVDGHDKWITIDSLQMGVGRAISMTGNGNDRDTSNPSFSEISMTKATDIASADLFMQAVAGKSLGVATIHFIQTASAKVQVFLTIELTGAIISSYSMGSSGERPNETFSIHFTKISYKYDSFNGDTVTTGTPKKWNVAGNELG
jgi:type VI secretion system secreted protein Hcp